jgi:cytochrome c oxidase subunit 1
VPATVLPVAVGLDDSRREVLVTTVLDAVPDNRHEHPGSTITPLLMALAIGVTFIGAIFTPWAYVVGFALSTAAFGAWAWPRGTDPKKVVMPRRGRAHEHAEPCA